MAILLSCYNRGCGQTFEEEKNSEESCRYHPGEPYFHDAYKGWSCCKKKSVDFTEFLSIKGCTLGKHSNVKPLESEKPVQEVHENNAEPTLPTPLEQIKRLPRPDVSTPMIQLEAKVAHVLKESIDVLPPLEKKMNKSSTEIAVGTVCTNAGCNKAYEGSTTDDTQCIFHPGVPIFHEGMKYWSCCQKKTSDFTAFMNQVGCNMGKHKWVKDDSQVQAVKCRWDWHQTASNIVVSVYAKMYDYRRSVIKINPIRLYVELVFPQQNDNKFIIDLELRGIIRVEDATVQMLGTKVEICLSKAEPGSWPKLEIPQKKIIKSENKQEKKEKAIEKDHDSDIDLDDLEMTGVQISEVK